MEIDEAVVSVAKDWFDFSTEDGVLNVAVADGLEYIRQLDSTGDYIDFVVIRTLLHLTVIAI